MFVVWILLLASAGSVFPLDSPLPGSAIIEPKTASYVEYHKGDPGTNVILTAPHDGRVFDPKIETERMAGCKSDNAKSDYRGCVYEKDASCAERACRVTTGSDSNIIPMTRYVAEVFKARTGFRPYIVISHLSRRMLDPNRDEHQGAQGDQIAIEHYQAFHESIQHARKMVKRGILFDMHGQSHMYNMTELGYRLSKTDLNAGNFKVSEMSVKSLVERCGWKFESGKPETNLFTHPTKSLGAIWEKYGYLAVPSPRLPEPGYLPADPKLCQQPRLRKYYRGGFITEHYGSKLGGEVDCIQVEAPFEMRSDLHLLRVFSNSIGNALAEFVDIHYVQATCAKVAQVPGGGAGVKPPI